VGYKGKNLSSTCRE